MLAPAAIATILADGCRTSELVCHPDEYQGCTCADGSAGYAQCAPGGSGYAACGSCGKTPGVDASTLPDGGSDGGLLPLYASCALDAECASSLCYAYTAKGSHCSHPCSSDSDCAAPSPQCTPKGVCKLP